METKEDVIQPAKCFASMHPGSGEPLPDDFCSAIQDLEKSLECQVWFIIQNSRDEPWSDIEGPLRRAFIESCDDLPEVPIALLVDSGGGSAACAYQIAKLLRRQCKSFTAVIPQYAKSAATLLSLGAKQILMGRDAQLGPLDVQVKDRDDDNWHSALEVVQAIERLRAETLTSFDEIVYMLLQRTGKTLNAVFPTAIELTTSMTRTLFEKVDVAQYMRMSRALKVGEDYAVKLLNPIVGLAESQKIASALVSKYPEHSFVIDADEALALGLPIVKATVEQERIFKILRPHLDRLTVAGKLKV